MDNHFHLFSIFASVYICFFFFFIKMVAYSIPTLLFLALAQTVKSLHALQETWVQSLGWEDPLDKGMQPTPVFLPGEFHRQRSLGSTAHRVTKSWTRLQRHYFANKGPSSQGYGCSGSHVWMWELDCEESWAPKNWCFWTVELEKTLESPLDCKEIQPVHPKGDQSVLGVLWKDWY